MTHIIMLCLLLLSGSAECQPELPRDRQLTRIEMLHALDRAGWDVEHWQEALEVSWCETRWKPYENGDDGRAFGLLQVHKSPWQRWSKVSGNMKNSVTGLRVAWLVFRDHEHYIWYNQWGCATEYNPYISQTMPEASQ